LLPYLEPDKVDQDFREFHEAKIAWGREAVG
jgi:hypothetical protein